MPEVIQTATFEGPVIFIPGLAASAFNKMRADAFHQIGLRWHQEFLPKHFTKEGEKEYNYTPRKGEEEGTSGKAFWRSYTGRKLKAKGHTLPLVWSGELRQGSKTARITATRNGVKVFLTDCQKAKFQGPNTEIDMAYELTHLSDSEREELVKMYNTLLQKSLDGFRVRQPPQFFGRGDGGMSVVGFFHGED